MLADRKAAFEKWWNTFPPERRVKKSACRVAFDMALYQIKADQDTDEEGAIKYLQDRTKRFAASPVANDKFCVSSERWLSERRWEDADEAWGYKRKAYVGTPIARQIAKAKQVQDEPKQNVLEGLYGGEVDAMSDDEALQVISPALRKMYAVRGKTGTIRDVLLKEISERARKE